MRYDHFPMRVSWWCLASLLFILSGCKERARSLHPERMKRRLARHHHETRIGKWSYRIVESFHVHILCQRADGHDMGSSFTAEKEVFMGNKTDIVDIVGREVLDSRGNPTVEVEVQLAGGVTGAGHSTGQLDLHLDRGVAARIQNLSPYDINDVRLVAHENFLLRGE